MPGHHVRGAVFMSRMGIEDALRRAEDAIRRAEAWLQRASEQQRRNRALLRWLHGQPAASPERIIPSAAGDCDGAVRRSIAAPHRR